MPLMKKNFLKMQGQHKGQNKRKAVQSEQTLKDEGAGNQEALSIQEKLKLRIQDKIENIINDHKHEVQIDNNFEVLDSDKGGQ